MEYKEKFGDLYRSAKEKYNIQQQPKLILRQDEVNAKKIYWKFITGCILRKDCMH